MNDVQKEINEIINKIWIKHPYLRYGQLLSGLKILEFVNTKNPELANHNLKDIFYNSDEDILKRIKSSQFYLDNIS